MQAITAYKEEFGSEENPGALPREPTVQVPGACCH